MTDPLLAQAIDEILKKSEILNAAVPEILTWVSPDDVMEQSILRSEYRNDVQKVIDKLSDMIGEIQSLKRKLRGVQTETRISEDKLESYKFSLLRQRKLLNG